ncbi:MAG TPA: hypothetical protein DCY80_14215 [Solibacterales bacterium]|nr:hypothetical protein [Bryobacterales bacterium]
MTEQEAKSMNSSTKNWWAALVLGVLVAVPLPAALLDAAATPVLSEPQENQKSSEMKGKIKSVNADSQTIEIDGVNHPVVVTANTRFGTGLSLSRLKEGDEVRVVGFTRPDGKFEAREIRLVEAGA